MCVCAGVQPESESESVCREDDSAGPSPLSPSPGGLGVNMMKQSFFDMCSTSAHQYVLTSFASVHDVLRSEC